MANTATQSLVPSQVVAVARPQKNNNKKKHRKSGRSKRNLMSSPDHDVNENILVPAQVSVSSSVRQQQHQQSSQTKNGRKVKKKTVLRLQQQPDSTTEDDVAKSNQAAEAIVKTKEQSQRQTTARPRKDKTSSSATPPNDSSKTTQQQNSQRQKPNNNDAKERNAANNRNTTTRKRRQPRFGNLPDVEWGAVSMDHLRLHPRFVPLPLPQDLPQLTQLEDVRNIRQDSWQWDALHEGRCTTSQAVAALGFLEVKAGKMLGVPSSWLRGGLGAYHRLRQPALRTLEEMNTVLLSDNDVASPTGSNNQERREDKRKQQSKLVWKETTTTTTNYSTQSASSGFVAAKYLAELSNRKKKERKRKSIIYAGNGMGIRMMWGNAQEATSVLTALNYFTSQDPNVLVKETGMCGAGLSLNQTTTTTTTTTNNGSSSPGSSSLLIGATPDAIIERSDGTIEALEVKNHCPFVISRPPRKKGLHHKNFTVRELPFAKPYIFPLYVPQLQLEMKCLGPQCRSAVMVRQTATNGALILRMHRDDEWIEEMLYWLKRFQQDFVEKGEAPMTNFFFDSPTADGPRYQSFLERTKEIANQVHLIAQIPHEAIQRGNPDQPMFLD